MSTTNSEAPDKETKDAIMTDINKGGAEQAAEAAWDEERLEAGLALLKEMYIQLHDLRSTIPRLIAPLTEKQPSPEILYRNFARSARAATDEVQQFRTLMEAAESQAVLAHARQSRALNPLGITPWDVTQEPDWLFRKEA